MALAAVLFAFPTAIAFAIFWSFLNNLGLTDAAILYVTAGGGVMLAFLLAGALTTVVDRP